MTPSLVSWLPRGNLLPDAAWRRRHRGIVALLWAHAAVIPLFAVIRRFPLNHVLLESLLVPAGAAWASWGVFSRRTRTLAASLGLLSASAILVHLSGGVIEMHFHFFVMVAVVSLYQDWLPFLAAVGYVFVHHAVLGAVDPESVFNHPAAWNHPWKWASIHALFIAGISVACLVAWRVNEDTFDHQRAAEERLRQETQAVETLNNVGRALAAELELHVVLQRVTDAVTELTAAEFGAFFYNEINERGEAYQLYTLSGVKPEAFSSFPMPRATAVFGPTFAGEGVVRYRDVTKEPSFGQSAPYYGMPEGHLPVRSYLAVPVMSSQGEVYGGLFFGHAEPGRFEEMHERLAVGVASHASVAIANARLYESERQARSTAESASARLEVLARAGQVLAASSSVHDTLSSLATLLTPSVADSCAVYLDNGKRQLDTTAARASYETPDGTDLASASIPIDHPAHPVARVARTGESVVLESVPTELVDASVDDQRSREVLRALEPTSAVIVPLQASGEVIGVLALGTVRQTGRRLTGADLALAEELGRRAAVAVEHARLYAAQRHVAETLQHSLLPEVLPTVPGLQIGARYVPGGPGAEVGGDWYDVLSFADGSVGFVMGDVVGRGVPAASLMGQIRNALRAYALEDKDPSRVLRRLNRLILDLGSSASMATLVYGILDLDDSTLTLSNAGHPPALVTSPGREPSYVGAGLGPPLGAVADPSYRNIAIELGPESTLVLYTDGLVEDRHMSLNVGLDKMRRFLAEAPTTVEGMCDHLMTEALRGRAGGDDAALLAVGVLPVGREVNLTLPRHPEVIRPLRATLRRQLRKAGASPQEEFEILVAAGEACANAIQHSGPTSPTFEFESSVAGEVRIAVRDRGRWRDQRPTDGGQGLTIMRHFMDTVDVQQSDLGTSVMLFRRLQDGTEGGEQ